MMRLSFLLFAFVACAAAVPQLPAKAGNVDALTIQQDVVKLVDNLFGDIMDERLGKICMEYDIKKDIENYKDKGVVKFLIRSVELRYILRKGYPFTTFSTKMRRDLVVVIRTLVSAKNYTTFIKAAAWIRCRFNEALFLRAFFTALLIRSDTREIVILPKLYEIFPYYYFDSKVITEAKDMHIFYKNKGMTKKYHEIKVDITDWLPRANRKLVFFTHDLLLNELHTWFTWMGDVLPREITGKDGVVKKTDTCVHCEIERGSQFLYMMHKICAYYELNRLSVGMPPMTPLDYTTDIKTPFHLDLIYPNGMTFPGRSYDVKIPTKYTELLKDVTLMEVRLREAIDTGKVILTDGTVVDLYDFKGLNTLGNLIEGTGRSLNIRYYGRFIKQLFKLLSGRRDYDHDFLNLVPGVLEIPHTTLRDPIFYKVAKVISNLYYKYTASLPMWTQRDVMLKGVEVADVKFSKLMTFCEKIKVRLDGVAKIPWGVTADLLKLYTVVDRLNHKPYDFEIIVNSVVIVKEAVVRVYLKSTYDVTGRYLTMENNRHTLIPIDQFKCDLVKGKNVIFRRFDESPMRSGDRRDFKDIMAKVEGALNSHEPLYTDKSERVIAWPENLALPKGRVDGLDVEIVVVITKSDMEPITYTPVVSEKYKTWHYFDFNKLIGEWVTKPMHMHHQDTYKYTDDVFGSGERFDRMRDTDDTTYMHRTRRSDDRLYDRKTDDIYNRHTKVYGGDDYVVDTDKVDRKYLTDYYKDKLACDSIGGFVSLDGRPLGWPFDRPMSMDCLWVPNIKVINAKIYHEEVKDCFL